jgi:hypothetical protein
VKKKSVISRCRASIGVVDMKLLFGGFIAVILLSLYVYAIYEALMVVICVSTPSCTQYTADTFTPGFSHAMSLVGGLVSALVIAELAVTKPGEAPVARAIGGASAAATLSWTLTIVTAIYLVVWAFVSLITANDGFGRDSDHV